MKVLIWIGSFIVITFLNVLLGAATGFQAGWLIFYAIWFFVSKSLCNALDESRERKRLEKEWMEKKNAPAAPEKPVNVQPVQQTPVAPVELPAQEPDVRPGDLPHYGALKQEGEENGRNVFLYRLGTYDADFARRCGQALLSQPLKITNVTLVQGKNEKRVPAQGLNMTAHPVFAGPMTQIRLSLMEGVRELSIHLTPGEDGIRILANPKTSQDAILLLMDRAVHRVIAGEKNKAEQAELQ